MSKVKWYVFSVATMLALVVPRAATASEGVDQLVQLAKAGMGETVLLEFVKSTPLPLDVTTDEILMLNDLGVGDAVIAEVISRGKMVRGKDVVDSKAAPGRKVDEPAEKPAPKPAPPPVTSAPPPVAPPDGEVRRR